ncbi:Serine/threonine-protein kinase StkP [Planctopirus ephydatiae]|uniref:Serine/threonine-protein kinase StkP n=1 Tax=Planctopirus ephydatiae TaxID=2528019 RepID=A0A518GKM7_9PLAN|nr:serine/threonine-protein kinase [Planctopirus ephydatiae]QDV29117.1 Serine/threonine-protein kinase StkP [Planctopirus ephydatiae]
MRFQYAPQSRPLAGYVITRGIQRGGFGEVYEGLSAGGKRVALKLLQRGTEIELRGVRQCLNLNHPNLVSIYDILYDNEACAWIVMEYIDGVTLDDVIANHPQGLPHDEVAEWFSGIVQGLEYLHSRGIVHRDLKPANIYRTHGVVKIGDVGLSKLMDQVDALHTQTIGTVHYMAPEVSHGRYGPSIDYYSLAVILYELLTGKVPFSGETTGEVLMRHLTHLPETTHLPLALRPVLQKALAKNAAERYPSLQEFHAAVMSALVPAGFEPVATVAREPVARSIPTKTQQPVSFYEVKKDLPPMPALQPPVPLTEFLPSGQKSGHQRLARRKRAETNRSRQWSPANVSKGEVARLIPGGWLGGWSQAVFLTMVLSMGLAAALAIALPPFVPSPPWQNLTGMGLLSAQSAVVVLALQTIFWWSRRNSDPPELTWMSSLLLGGVMGASGYLLMNYLMAENLLAAPEHAAMVRQLGAQKLRLDGGVPSWLSWVLYFASLVALGNWSQQASLQRDERFSAMTILFSTMAGWMLSFVIWFPPVWGCLFAAWISCVLQLSTPVIQVTMTYRESE